MKHEILAFAKELLAIDSPTGYAKKVIPFMEEKVSALGYTCTKNEKGNLQIHIEGESDKTIGLCAHVDTLGLMVR